MLAFLCCVLLGQTAFSAKNGVRHSYTDSLLLHMNPGEHLHFCNRQADSVSERA